MALAGNAIYYEIHGHGSNVPVVLIMGLAMDSGGWVKQVPVLSQKRRVVILDNRGVGRSGRPPGPYTTAEMADDAVGVLDAAGIGRAHVIGVSLGGAIAQELALRHARRVKSLVLVATFARADEEMHRAAQDGTAASTGGASAAMHQIAEGKIALDPKLFMKFIMPLVVTQAFIDRERAWLREMYNRTIELGFSAPAIAAQVGAALSHDTVGRLSTLAPPTLVILGTRDLLVAPRLTRRLAQLIPRSQLWELEGAPHGLLMEHADEVNPVLDDWLARHD